jgi:hypothetical protein
VHIGKAIEGVIKNRWRGLMNIIPAEKAAL